MRLNFSTGSGSSARGFLVFFFGLLVSLAGAAMSPPEITLACNGLARMSFDLKDLVNLVALKRNPGPFQVRHCVLEKPNCPNWMACSGYPR